MAKTTKARIMLIDNERRVVDPLREVFEKEVFEVLAVIPDLQTEDQQIINLARRFRPHVVVLDLRLRNQYTDDRSGIALLLELSCAHCILHSAFTTLDVKEQADELLSQNKQQANRIQKKRFEQVRKENPQKLVDRVKTVAAELSYAASQVTINYPDPWDLVAMTNNIARYESILPSNSIQDLLVQLFPNAKRITLDTVSGAITEIASASKGRSLVFKVYRDDLEPVVVKISRVHDGRSESENFSEYMRERVSTRFRTDLIANTEFWDLTASAYEFVGSTLEHIPNFSDFYEQERSFETICQPLQHFFSQGWQRHYHQKKALDLQYKTLYQYYDEILDLTTGIRRLQPDNEKIDVASLGCEIPNPAHWLDRFKLHSVFPALEQAVTHGDLHGDNLFVIGEHAMVIDFERTGWGHILRDIVELEADVATRLLILNGREFFEFAIALTKSSFPGTTIELPPNLENEPIAQKAATVVTRLRKLAQNITHYSDHREYLWSLLFDCLFIATKRRFAKMQKDRALILSSLICQRLAQWQRPWPSKEVQILLANIAANKQQ